MKIYKITNIVTGNYYIGKTTRTLDKRFYCHKYAALKNTKKSHLHLAMNKYGHENFIIEEICSAANECELNLLEMEYIINLLPYYNKAPGGKGGRFKGFNMTQDHKNKISIAMKGKKLTKDHIEKAAYNRSKIWEFIDPTGNRITIRNLSEFCRINKLNQSHMVSISIGRYGFKTHKGYRMVIEDR